MTPFCACSHSQVSHGINVSDRIAHEVCEHAVLLHHAAARHGKVGKVEQRRGILLTHHAQMVGKDCPYTYTSAFDRRERALTRLGKVVEGVAPGQPGPLV